MCVDRCVEVAHNYIRIINVLDASLIVTLVVFELEPYYVGGFPLTVWTPYDQTANSRIYAITYLAESISVFIAVIIVLCTDTYILLVLTRLNFNYSLLAERVQHIELPTNSRYGNKIDTYQQMVILIKLHMKINGWTTIFHSIEENSFSFNNILNVFLFFFVSSLMDKVTVIFNELFFVQILQSAVCFATTAFLLIMVNLGLAEILFFMTFLVSYTVEMIEYCYFSDTIASTVNSHSLHIHCSISWHNNWTISPNFLYVQYETISDGAYFGNFLEYDIKTKKAMQILITNINLRPVKIETISIVRYELTLQLFLKVLLDSFLVCSTRWNYSFFNYLSL